MKFLDSSASAPSIRMAPLIDIIFLMLIFFVTTSAMETFEKDIAIDLPKGDIPALAAGAPHLVYVELDANGIIKLEGSPIGLDDLRSRLKALVNAAPDLKVILRADARAIWQSVVDVSEAITLSGVSSLYYASTDRPTTQPEK